MLIFLCFGFGHGQTLWLQGGLGYVENDQYIDYLKLGLKGELPVSDTVSVYLSPYWLGGLGIDVGLVNSLETDLEDLEDFGAHIGAGLSLIQGRFGLALNAGISYEISRDTQLALMYTHRPLFAPLSQAFDLSLALGFNFK